METTPQESFITTQLAKFDVNVAELTKLAEEYKGLTVTSVDDKAGLVSVRNARIILKGKRVAITKTGKDLRAQANSFNKAVIDRERELIALIEPTEEALQAEEDRIEAEKEHLRLAVEQAEAKRVQDRIDALRAVDAAHDLLELKMGPDDWFAELLTTATEAFNKKKAVEEQDRIAKEEFDAAEKVRMEQVAKDQEAERQRLDAVRKEQEAKAEELRLKQKAIDDQQADIDRKKREEEAAAQKKIDDEAAEKKRLEDLETARKEGEEKARVELERKQNEEDEKKRIAEEERLKELEERPDKAKLKAYAMEIFALASKAPTLTTETGNKILTQVIAHLKEVANSLLPKGGKK